MRFVDPILNNLVWSSCLAHNASQVGEAVKFFDGLAINGERDVQVCIYSRTLDLDDIDL